MRVTPRRTAPGIDARAAATPCRCLSHPLWHRTGFAAAGALDWLDGYIARKYNMTVRGNRVAVQVASSPRPLTMCPFACHLQSILGSYLDPVADKVLVGFLAAAMTWKGLLAWPVVALVLTRDIGLVGGAFWYRYKTKPPGMGFWDVKRAATFEIQPSAASKVGSGVLGTVVARVRATVPCRLAHRARLRVASLPSSTRRHSWAGSRLG